MIKKISIVCALGAETYELGRELNGVVVAEIKIAPIMFTGDPFDHYCGFDDGGKLLFTVNCSAPSVVEYV